MNEIPIWPTSASMLRHLRSLDFLAIKRAIANAIMNLIDNNPLFCGLFTLVFVEACLRETWKLSA